MVTDDKKRHYLTVKRFSVLLKGITSHHQEDFYYFNRFHSYSTEEKLKKYERVCNDHDYCYVKVPDKDKKMLKYNYEEKSIRVSFIIYADLECLLEKSHSHETNLEKYYIEKKLNIRLLFIHCLQIVHLIQQKISLIVTEVEISNLRYKTPTEIPVVFHNVSIYDYHFIINQLAKEFHGQLECLGENKEK